MRRECRNMLDRLNGVVRNYKWSHVHCVNHQEVAVFRFCKYGACAGGSEEIGETVSSTGLNQCLSSTAYQLKIARQY
jgi:hypothetical protein